MHYGEIVYCYRIALPIGYILKIGQCLDSVNENSLKYKFLPAYVLIMYTPIVLIREIMSKSHVLLCQIKLSNNCLT